MRYFFNLYEALSEIRRDLAKAPSVEFTRVQQFEGDYPGREIQGYTYSIQEVPTEINDFMDVMADLGFDYYMKHRREIRAWLHTELRLRLGHTQMLETADDLHPGLQNTFEGQWPSYTYTERLHGSLPVLSQTLLKNRDSRRAFWPIFRPEDSLRAMSPTRIPCSLGYGFMLRSTPAGERLLVHYLQRSADFDIFFGTDIFLTSRYQKELAGMINVPAGLFQHTILSLHSFEVEGVEIY